MDYKIIILKIIKENQPLGIHKLDRLFHKDIEYSISWLPYIEELRKALLIEESGYKITTKGLEYIEKHLKA